MPRGGAACTWVAGASSLLVRIVERWRVRGAVDKVGAACEPRAMSINLTVLGCGTMGRAILGGLLASGLAESWTLCGTVRHGRSADRLRAALPITVSLDNAESSRRADVVLLGVKPQSIGSLLGQPAMVEALADTLVISICAGVTLSRLEALLPNSRVVRAMPNTPALIGEGMSVLSPGVRVTEADLALARSIFESVGRCRVLDEKHMDAVTGLSGSGPAFACVILESLADGGVMMGLPRDVAIELAAQTLQGAARLVLETNEHPAALRDRVTTPAGCTIAGLFMMEEGRIRSTLARTVQEAAQVAASLGKER
jgi:pyrroline-5-carboxylate reductase